MSDSEKTSSGFEPGYPTNTVFAVIDGPQNTNDAVSALMQTPIDSENIEIICNDDAEQRIRELKEARPVATNIANFLAEAGEEDEEWDTYNHWLNEGRYLIRVPVENGEQAARVADVLRQHGGHYVNHFAPFTVTRLAP